MGFFEADWLIDDTNKLHRALSSVESIKEQEQEKLKRVVLEAPRQEVRAAAMRKLSDSAILAELAKTMPQSDVRRQAVVKITDQSVVADVAENDENIVVRNAAIETLTDQAALRRIAVNEKEKDLILLAISKLDKDNPDNQAVFAELAKNREDWRIRTKAAAKLSDEEFAQKVYSEVVRYPDLSDKNRRKVVKRLTDQPSLAYVAKLPTTLSKEIFVLREKALKRITDPSALKDIAENAPDESIRRAAAEKLSVII